MGSPLMPFLFFRFPTDCRVVEFSVPIAGSAIASYLIAGSAIAEKTRAAIAPHTHQLKRFDTNIAKPNGIAMIL